MSDAAFWTRFLQQTVARSHDVEGRRPTEVRDIRILDVVDEPNANWSQKLFGLDPERVYLEFEDRRTGRSFTGDNALSFNRDLLLEDAKAYLSEERATRLIDSITGLKKPR